MNSSDERAATWDDDPIKVERATVMAGAICEAITLNGSQRLLEYGAPAPDERSGRGGRFVPRSRCGRAPRVQPLQLAAALTAAGFTDVAFRDCHSVVRERATYSMFLATCRVVDR